MSFVKIIIGYTVFLVLWLCGQSVMVNVNNSALAKELHVLYLARQS